MLVKYSGTRNNILSLLLQYSYPHFDKPYNVYVCTLNYK